MDIDEKILESYQAHSRNLFLLMAAVTVISVYIVSRAINVFFDHEFALRVVKTEMQGDWQGLKFSYVSLSLIWPLILASTSLFVDAVANKVGELSAQVSTYLQNVPVQVSRISAYGIEVNDFPAPSFLFFIRYLPFLAIAFHASALVYAFAVGANFPIPCQPIDCGNPNENIGLLHWQYLVFLFSNIVCIGLSLFWLKDFPGAVKKSTLYHA
ncbi:MAG: hypothetical protein OEZ39_12310 [Gammaproteobacteria bacterium]|nr:hypothetical protein [Gammaproteobacteria bacterium]MDH5652628.1 hypothetical protein [Gammaproteobacteria bacterium]